MSLYQFLDQSRTIAVGIDIQEKLWPHIARKKKLLIKIEQLLAGCEILEVPILLTEQYPQGLGPTVPELRPFAPVLISKTAFSCCRENSFMEQVSEKKPSHIILAGIETHVCVQQTALDLLNHGYHVVIAADAVGSRKKYHKTIALNLLQKHGAIISSVESILFELAGDSSGAAFRQVLQVIKSIG